MASIKRRRGSALWTCFYRDGVGKQHCRSTGTCDRKLALSIATQYEASARTKRTLRQFSRVLADMHELVNGESVGHDKTLRGFAREWLEQKKPETAPATWTFYSESARKFVAFCGERADAPLLSLLKGDLVAYRNALSRDLAPATVNHHLKFTRMLFKAARREGLISDDPTEFVEAVRRTEGISRRAFTLEEITALLSVADPEWRSMILFGLYTGQRLGDIASITWANVDLEKAQLRLVTRKTSKRLILPLAGPLLRHLEALTSSDQLDSPLHPKAARIVKAQGRTGALSNQFSDLLVQVGLREKKLPLPPGDGHSTRRKSGSELSFHSFRHTATSMMCAAGVPAATTQAFIGHSSEAVHLVYTHVGTESLKQAANALPEL